MCHLQELHARFADKGLVILGLDCSDDKKIALEMLHDNGATFPNIIDSSKAAVEVCFRKYQGKWHSAVPMSYIIDRDGKVADAWYGYEEGETKTLATLKKLGGELGEAIARDEQLHPKPLTKAEQLGNELAEGIRRLMHGAAAWDSDKVAADAKRLFDAIRAADYDHDWISTNDWEHFPAKDVDYCVDHNYPGWVTWVCKKFKANPIEEVRLGKPFANAGGTPTVHFELQLKDGELLQGDLPFKQNAKTGQWVGQLGLDWHLKESTKRERP
jgi:hypothetical protein